MPQQEPHRNPSESGDPPIGECATCGKPVTRDHPGTLTFVASTGSMATVHDQCPPDEDEPA